MTVIFPHPQIADTSVQYSLVPDESGRHRSVVILHHTITWPLDCWRAFFYTRQSASIHS